MAFNIFIKSICQHLKKIDDVFRMEIVMIPHFKKNTMKPKPWEMKT